MSLPPAKVRSPLPSGAFTLVELIVSMGVLVLMMILITQLFNSATAITTMGNNHMDADSQARAVFDRMSVDFSQIVKRTDVDYFLKDINNQETISSTNATGNDQLAFYSQVPGYYLTGSTAPSSGITAPASLVGYRVNTSGGYCRLERYGCGLFWNGMASGSTAAELMPLVFSGSSTSSGANTIAAWWPASTGTASDPNYEPIGPEIFRMEYFYMLKGQALSSGTYNSQLSDVPWDQRIAGHTSVNGLQDVAAIGVVIAVINPKSRVLVSGSSLAALAGQLGDFPHINTDGATFASPTATVGGVSYDMTKPGGLESEWDAVIASGTTGIPRVAASSIRVYKRYFYLSPNTAPNL